MRRVVATLLVLTLAGPVEAARFEIVPGKDQRVEFESKAPMETFRGKTQDVRGFFVLDPAALADSIAVEVRVDLASLDTGLEMRNKHMRDNHLETDRFPLAVFRGGRVGSVASRALAPDAPLAFVLTGELELHGMRQAIELPVEIRQVTHEAGQRLRVTTHFQVKLSDFGIARPKMLLLKLDEVQHVTVELIAVSAN